MTASTPIPLLTAGPVVAVIHDTDRYEWTDPTLGEVLEFEAVTGLDYNGTWWGTIRGVAGYVLAAHRRTHPDATWADLESWLRPGALSIVLVDEVADALLAKNPAARPTVADPQ